MNNSANRLAKVPAFDPAWLENMRGWNNLSERLKYWAEQRGDQPFVTVGTDTLSFAELDRQADSVAAGLAKLGAVHGERAALIMKNRIEFVVAFFALARLGVVVTPVNIYLRGDFLAHQLLDCQAAIVIGDADAIESVKALIAELQPLREIICVDPVIADGTAIRQTGFAALLKSDPSFLPLLKVARQDLMAILYTSGTTGMPKGCMLTHGYYLNAAIPYYQCGWYEPKDVLYSAYPLYHASGNLLTLATSLQIGNRVVYASEFSARRFMTDASAAGATVVVGISAMGMAILASPEAAQDSDNNLRIAIWIPMTEENQILFTKRFGVPVVSEGYGQTEISPATMASLSAPRTPGSCGFASPMLEVKIFNDLDEEVPRGTAGEIVVRPREPNVMFSGYWGRPDATVESFRNLWHHTGDAALMNEAGEVFYVDRKKDAMRRRGINVSSVQLEQVIIKHPQIAAVAVHAVPSPLGEDDIKACIVLAEGADLPPDELFNFFRKSLPYYAVPRYFEFLTALPVNAMGRVMKYELRKAGIGHAMDFEALGITIGRDERRS